MLVRSVEHDPCCCGALWRRFDPCCWLVLFVGHFSVSDWAEERRRGWEEWWSYVSRCFVQEEWELVEQEGVLCH